MFSVVVPTYNRPKLLQKLLESLENQSLPKTEFEVIVVYTHPDTSEKALQAMKTTYSLTQLCIEDPVFSGKSASLKRNRGAQAARYEWLAFVDDDCIVDQDWLLHAKRIIHQSHPVAIEGLTKIPISEKPTFTAKGLTALSQFGGYQTCNMFYNKSAFMAVGGFDQNLPFYLEDTDLAWSILEKDQLIIPAQDVVVTHPVPAPYVYRWIENAIRTRQIPYLAKKHPALFKKNKFKALSRSNLFFIAFLFLILLSFVTVGSIATLALGLGLYIAMTTAYVFYLLRQCTYTGKELFQLIMTIPIVAPISFFQLMRGNIEQRTFVI